MAFVKFNYVDDYSESLAKKIELEPKTNWKVKLKYQAKGNELVSFQNKVRDKAQELAEKYSCTLQNGCQSPIGAGWEHDNKGNIIGEKFDMVLILYVFHGNSCFKAAEELDKFINSLT